jgi:hypothetical protein
VRVCETPAAARAAASAASETVDTAPSPPAAAKASAIVFAHLTSWSLASSHLSNAVTRPSALIFPHEHFVAKSSRLPRKPAGFPERALLRDVDPVANERRSSGLAEDVPPPPLPPAPGFGVWRVVDLALAGANVGGSSCSTLGGCGAPATLSCTHSKKFRSPYSASQSRAFLRRAFSRSAAAFIWSTQPATVRRFFAMSSASAFAFDALSVNSCEKWPRNSCDAVLTYDCREPACPSIDSAAPFSAVLSASAVPLSNLTGSLPCRSLMVHPPKSVLIVLVLVVLVKRPHRPRKPGPPRVRRSGRNEWLLTRRHPR